MAKKSWILFVFMLITTFTFSQSKDEQAIAQAVEKLRKAMVDADKNIMESLVSDQLSYGHSTGAIEDKKLFVNNIISGKSDFVTMELTEQTITIVDNAAIVRNKLDATTNDSGKPGEAHLFVLMVWQKKDGQWKLLARQAVKQPVKS